MEPWIDRLLVGCGGAAGLLLGTGHTLEGVALAIAAIAAACVLRARTGWHGAR